MTDIFISFLIFYWVFASLVMVGFKFRDEEATMFMPMVQIIGIILMSFLLGAFSFPLWIGYNAFNKSE